MLCHFQEKESVFLLDDKRISEINMMSGRTKKRTPRLHPLLNSVVTMASSYNGELQEKSPSFLFENAFLAFCRFMYLFIFLGSWLCGLLVSGELFLWNRDKDLLKTAAAAPEIDEIITPFQGMYSRKLVSSVILQFKVFIIIIIISV